MLRARILSALVMIPVALLAIWSGGVAFALLVAAAAAVMAWEWTRMVSGGAFALAGQTAALLCSLAALTALWSPPLALTLLAAAVVAAISLVRPHSLSARRWLGLGMIYCGLPAIALVWLRGADQSGLMLMLWLMLLVWATDIGAYAAGRTVGGPLLLPSVSPKKTWAGLIGGMVSAALVGVVAALFFLPVASPLVLGGLSAGLAVVAQAGDLLESWVKRRWGVKDSSNIIPGHGGVLDRVDGLLAAGLAVAGFHLLTGA